MKTINCIKIDFRIKLNSDHDQSPLQESEDLVIKVEKIYTTLLRDHTGLGFSIAGGLGAAPYKEGSDSLYVSKVTEGGAAAKDAKLLVGDKIVQINGVDVTDARHDQAVQMLTGLERFVRLVVERDTLVPRSLAPGSLNVTSSSDKSEKSPKVFGVPKPYTGLYSASSYMANRPSYGLRNREPGNYTMSASSPGANNEAPATYNANYKLPGLGGIPGENKSLGYSSGTSPGLLATARSSSALATSSRSDLTSPGQFDAMIPEGVRARISSSVSQPSGVTAAKPSVVTESITKTTFTETTVKRVTNTAVTEQVAMRRSGGASGPLHHRRQ